MIMLNKDYNRNVSLQCATCGSTCSFVTDEKTGIIICKRCNRVYYDNYDECLWQDWVRLSYFHKLSYKLHKKDMEKDVTFFDVIIKKAI